MHCAPKPQEKRDLHTTDVRNDLSVRFLETFLYAGASALLIAVARLHSDYTFVSLFALVPFLWRAVRAGLVESLVLGAILGTLFCFVTSQSTVREIPTVILFHLPVAVILFSFYGIAVNRISKHIGLNAVFLAVLWLPVEYSLGLVQLGGLFDVSASDSAILVRVSSLFGALVVTFLIAVTNSLILVASRHLTRLSGSKAPLRAGGAEEAVATCVENAIRKLWYSITAIRGPPSPAI
jgi:apolipoprotein N-acyltransferase